MKKLVILALLSTLSLTACFGDSDEVTKPAVPSTDIPSPPSTSVDEKPSSNVIKCAPDPDQN